VVGLALTLLALPAGAQTRDENLAQCAGADPDASINACTALLQSGQEQALLSSIYTDRGLAYAKKGLYDQGIADLTQAIALVPTNAYAYNDRATAYIREGRREQAIADYRAALNLDPTLQSARVTLLQLGVAP
jgi:tetratricopeptide (TPR) repeat protein